MYTDDFKFVDTHEWVKVENGDTVLVGVTNHAQELLGDLVYVELPKAGSKIKSHEIIGVIESVKAASDLYSPIDGEVVAINEAVVNDPSVVNNDPHAAGWLLKIKLSNSNQLDDLMSAAQYKALIGA